MRFASRLDYLTDDSFVRAMDVAANEKMISFAAGSPDSSTYPLDEIEKSINNVIERDGRSAFGYCATRGQYELREIISRRMKESFGLEYAADEVIITNGSQQGLNMSGMLFINKGDVVLFEEPSYLGAVNALRAYEAELVSVPTDREGMDITALKATLEKYGGRVSMIYVNPDYQNPTGRCWSEERRKEFMELLEGYDIPVLEDGAYAELSFTGKRYRPLAYYDRKGQVVYIGTFSKTFCPGVRTAWLCAGKELIERYMILKNASDLSSSALFQLAIVDYMDRCDYDAHLAAIGKLYSERCAIMAEAIDMYLPKSVHYEKPEGGLFIWLELPEDTDTLELLKKAEKNGVAFVPGASFYPARARTHELRLNYSNVSPEKIREGIKKLAEVL
jgi:2-aminoadipate transaminase